MRNRRRTVLFAVILALSFFFVGCRTDIRKENGPGNTQTETWSAGIQDKTLSTGIQTETTSVHETASAVQTQESSEKKVVEEITQQLNNPEQIVFDVTNVPAYSGKAYVVINNNVPYFKESELTTTSFESYAKLDEKERCGVCVASVGTDIMPMQKRSPIGNVKPSGWKQAKYSGVVEGNYLYNRCHLIGYQLTGENDNIRNLITGTRYLNTQGMLPFEDMVADYVKETRNHVLYRVTPYFEGDNLLAKGVLMEAKSVEDGGAGIMYCVFCYNVQPGVFIDYSDGSSRLETGASP